LAFGKLLDDILIDQGLVDEFLEEQLSLEDFEAGCDGVGQKLTVRRHEGMTFLLFHCCLHLRSRRLSY
jgi:S-formylglutathione hydrolase FrmB